ncbi:MAG: hypothetical protein JNJ57_15375 [Saprospiraceae bacterium]|nr:hypothetical protein [Saprospiraceae bacterium]
MPSSRILGFLVVFPWLLAAQSFTPGQSYFGANNYVEYIAGNMPIILSAPHGGLLSPASIPDRDCSGCSTVNDFNTQELARALANSMYERTGCHPHLVINRLHRRKLDANRDLPEAADGNPTAGQAWTDFHNFLGGAKNTVTWTFGKGFYVDLHGHAHTIQRLELGYLLNSDELRLPDDSLNNNTYTGYSSIQNLAENNAQNLSHADLLHGEQSLGELLHDRGYAATPSFTDPAPDPGEDYFSGGYNTARYGSYNGGAIDGVQIECNRTGIRDSLTQVERFADTLAVALIDYIERHYFNGLGTVLCNSTSAPDTGTNPWQMQLSPNPYCRSFQISQNDPGAVWQAEIFDFYGNLLFVRSLEAGISEQITFPQRQNVFVVLRRNGEIATARTVLHYCR